VFSALVAAVSCAFLGRVAFGARPAPQAPPPVRLVAPAVTDASDVPPPDPHVLRVCADPNNFPFSDRAQAGFENRIAELAARELHRKLAYYWRPQRRGFVRTTLNANRCDVIMGVPASADMVRVTAPYYRSSYVFVSRRARHLSISSFDDPRLRRLRIGIPMVGDDGGNPPPAEALARRHIFDNVRGYAVYGDYSQPRPSWGVLNAVADGEIDVAVAWGPLAGYFARHAADPIDLAPVSASARSDRALPFAFDIAMAVRRSDVSLAAALDEVIARRAAEIRRILVSYGVPLAAARREVKG